MLYRKQKHHPQSCPYVPTLATAHDCTRLQAIGRISLTNVVGMWAGRKIPRGFHSRFLTASFKPFLYFWWGWLVRCSLNGGAYALMWKFLKCLEGQQKCWGSHQFFDDVSRLVVVTSTSEDCCEMASHMKMHKKTYEDKCDESKNDTNTFRITSDEDRKNWFQDASLYSCTVATHEHFEMDTQQMV